MRTRLAPLHKNLVAVLAFARVEAFLPHWHGLPGRPLSERAALARAFIAKAVFNLPTTTLLREVLLADAALRLICGWQHVGEVPSGSTFSRAFAEFAKSSLAERLHEALIAQTLKDPLIGHISRDSTAIEAREKPQKPPAPPAAAPPVAAPPVAAPPAEAAPVAASPAAASPAEAAPAAAAQAAAPPAAALPAAAPPQPPRKRGRPRKDAPPAPPKPERRLARQIDMSIKAMLDDLPRACDRGTKRNARGHQTSWVGYKLHIDTADGGIPISCVLTSASVHDSQVAIPLASITAKRVTSCYDLMDSAYDAAEIRQHSKKLGHVPIIDPNPRGKGAKARQADEEKSQSSANFCAAETVRYRERTTAERVNAALKDNHGGRFVRVRGAAKVMSHLMFGILSVTALSLMRLNI